MRIAGALEIVAMVLILGGWLGARFSPFVAKHLRRLVTAGIVVMLIDVGIGAVRGAVAGYHEAIARANAARQHPGPAR